METTHIEPHAREPAPAGRRPMSLANWVGLFLLLALFVFYLSFAIPEFTGIVSGPPLAIG